MTLELVVFGYFFFQLAAGLVLIYRREEPRMAVQVLALMLVLNAAVSALWFEWWPPRDDARALASAFDAPTEILLFALLAALTNASWSRRVTSLLVGAAAGVGLAAPWLLYSAEFEQVRGAIFFVGLALVSFRLARGTATWERWAALAFLPRAFYWATSGTLTLRDFLTGVASPKFLPLLFTVPFLVVVSLAATARLLRAPSPPGRLVVVGMVLVGPAIALSEGAILQTFPVNLVLLPPLSLLTLAVFRPFFLLKGFAPEMIRTVASRALVAAGVGAGAYLLIGNYAYPGVDRIPALLGFVAGFAALVLMEVHHPRFEGWDAHPVAAVSRAPSPMAMDAVATAAAPPAVPLAATGEFPQPASGNGAPDGAEVAPRAGPRMPYWQALILELRGSAKTLATGTRELPDARWTQQGLMDATGLPRRRVSEFPLILNEGAEGRLDAYLPGWRGEMNVPSPKLVEVHKGLVPGTTGVRVYYRLTPLGERLAEAVAAHAEQVAAEDVRS